MTQFYHDYGNPHVERLARVLCQSSGADPDEMVPDNGHEGAPMVPAWWKRQAFAKDFLICAYDVAVNGIFPRVEGEKS